MLLKVTSKRCLTGRLRRLRRRDFILPNKLTIFLICVVSVTSPIIFVITHHTKTVDNFRLLMQMSYTCFTTGPRAVVVSNITAAFRGSLIKSSDQLTNIDVNWNLCLKANVGGMTFPICTYEPAKDVYISKSFKSGGYWERPVIDRFIRLLRRYADVEFVDLGANIGTFTLPAARITHVVAVEPYSRSIARLFSSIQLGGVAKNVSLVFNAISDVRSTYALGFYSENVGGTYLKSLQAVNTTDCRGGSCTSTILLDDLLPLMRGRRAVMKVDVEAHQPRVFTNDTAAQFFELIDVPLLYMEWGLCNQQNVRSEVLDLIRFFTERQYQVFSENNRRMGTDCRQWGNNVIFTKLQTSEF